MIEINTASLIAEPAELPGSQTDRRPAVWLEECGGGATADEILREVDRIIGSEDFPASKRNRRALRYVVDCALHDRTGEITAYHIATRVYRRSASFHPHKDPIVRIEMAKLRRDLETYYLKNGRGSKLRIGIPKGGYVPRVTRHAAGDAPLNPFLVSVLRAALSAWSGADGKAAAAWQDLLLADPDLVGNLHSSVLRAVGDEEVAALIVEGVLRAARRTA